MGDKGQLTGWSFLITRPEDRGNRLSAMLKQLGALVVQRPSLVIGEIDDPLPVVAAMEDADLAIFVSVYAAGALGRALAIRSLCGRKSLEIAAVGRATSDALEQLGLAVKYMPAGSSGSEGLIDVLADKNWSGRDVALFCAENGRQLLAEWLIDRGANVSRIIAYTRQPNPAPAIDSIGDFLASPQRVIVFTSLESARALASVIPPESRKRLCDSNLIVISQRIADGCRSLGFHGKLDVAGDTSDRTVLALALRQAGCRRTGAGVRRNDNSGGEGL